MCLLLEVQKAVTLPLILVTLVTIKPSDIFNERLESHCAVYKTGSVISPGDDDLNSDPGPSDRADHHDASG